jgi:hypothetical protein
MSKRLHDTDIWGEDWFFELPNKYKLLWLYVKDKCDNVGIWRPNKSNIESIVGERLKLDEFLGFVNVNKVRILILESGRWFIKSYFTFQYGDRFSPCSQVHRGAIKSLLTNGIHPKEILQNSLGYLQFVDLQTFKEIAYAKDTNRLYEAYQQPIDTTINIDISINKYIEEYNVSLKEKKSKNKKNEITNFATQGYDLLASKLQG